MHSKGILVPNVNDPVGFRFLDTFSDVLAIYQEPVRSFFPSSSVPLMPLFHLFLSESRVHRYTWRYNCQVGHQNVGSQPRTSYAQGVQVKLDHTVTYDWTGWTLGRQHGRPVGSLRPQISAPVHSHYFIPWPREFVQPKAR